MLLKKEQAFKLSLINFSLSNLLPTQLEKFTKILKIHRILRASFKVSNSRLNSHKFFNKVCKSRLQREWSFRAWPPKSIITWNLFHLPYFTYYDDSWSRIPFLPFILIQSSSAERFRRRFFENFVKLYTFFLKYTRISQSKGIPSGKLCTLTLL